MRLILDTSVIISILLSRDKSHAKDILKMLYLKKVTLISSKEIFIELRTVISFDKIKRYNNYNSRKVGSFIAWHQHHAEFISIPSNSISSVQSRDINDNKYLILAEISKADYLITIDKDLLVLKKFGKTKIVTPEDFILSLL